MTRVRYCAIIGNLQSSWLVPLMVASVIGKFDMVPHWNRIVYTLLGCTQPLCLSILYCLICHNKWKLQPSQFVMANELNFHNKSNMSYIDCVQFSLSLSPVRCSMLKFHERKNRRKKSNAKRRNEERTNLWTFCKCYRAKIHGKKQALSCATSKLNNSNDKERAKMNRNKL